MIIILGIEHLFALVAPHGFKMHSNTKILKPGSKFFYLTVIKTTNKRSGRAVLWSCKCDCGKEVLRTHYSLVNKRRTSCGCFTRELTIKRNTKHGKSRTKVYKTWKGIFERCFNKNSTSYKNYGGRGITVCKRWEKFENFNKDMGEPPTPKHSIDRINNNGNYEPTNCRWATKYEQAGNQRGNRVLKYKGQEKILADWAREYKINRYCLFERLKKMPIHEALTKPLLKRRTGTEYKCVNGHVFTPKNTGYVKSRSRLRRYCKKCVSIHMKKYYKKNKLKTNPT